MDMPSKDDVDASVTGHALVPAVKTTEKGGRITAFPSYSSFPIPVVPQFPSFSSGPRVFTEQEGPVQTSLTGHGHGRSPTIQSSFAEDSYNEASHTAGSRLSHVKRQRSPSRSKEGGRVRNTDRYEHRSGRESHNKAETKKSRKSRRSTSRDRRLEKSRKRQRSNSHSTPAETLTFKRDGHKQVVLVETRDYFMDRKGDAQNLAFECVYRYTVPHYKRWGDDIWGTNGKWRIDYRESHKSKHLVVRDTQVLNAFGTSFKKDEYRELRQALREKPLNLSSRSEVALAMEKDLNRDYIQFPKLQSKESVSTDDLLEDPEFRSRTADFNKRLHEEPQNLSLWLEFIDFQHEFGKKDSSATTHTVINERTQSIYEKALLQFPDNEHLLSRYMTCCEELMETAEVLTKWDKILKRHSQSMVLWKQYLEYRQTNYNTFTVNGCIELYQNCLEIMIRDTKSDGLKREQIMIHIFSRAVKMLSEAGYVERAIALFQAMIEFSCFCPPAFAKQTFQQRLGMFESFWEQDHPRFGEDGAQGWATSIMNDNEDDVLPTLSSKVDNRLDMSEPDDFGRWLHKERRDEFFSWLPARTVDEESDTDDIFDPFRNVLFDDISSLMFDIHENETRIQLLHTFLQFLGVPFNNGKSSNDESFQDCFLENDHLNHARAAMFWPAPMNDIQNMQREEGARFSQVFDVPLHVFPQTADCTFAAGQWFDMWSKTDADVFETRAANRRTFVRNVLQQWQSLPYQHQQPLALLIAFENGFDTKGAQKATKTLLKTERMNLSLWDAYARVEMARGKMSEASNVYMTSLLAYRSFPLIAQADAPLLHRMAAECFLRDNKKKAALSVLLAFGAGDPVREEDLQNSPSPTYTLKARKGFMQALERLFSFVDWDIAMQATTQEYLHYLLSYSWMEYLVLGLDEAIVIFEQSLDRIQSQPGARCSAAEEAIFEGYARLLFYHVTSGVAFKPAILRTALESALAKFPHNTMFLALYGWNEARTKIENRVRRLVDQELASNPSHVLWKFAIWAELHQRQTFNVNLVRSLFERALKCSSSRHSASLWSLYIQFEVQHGDESKSKTLFFRAIQECPWCKDLYLIPFSLLRDVFAADELSEIFSLMEEKEIRIRNHLNTP
ncbi:NRDE-2, necessary for RNA interference-domain-containing protein [Phlyctochytrium arcticum]|nr:NRDE-2, necessary for RNA interference-domain-containing protein [Phlyctochytrium arcticum]